MSMDTTTLFRLLGLCLLFAAAIGYPNGPPSSTCLTMYPKHHGVNEQETESPYKIILSPSTYTPGQQIQVEIYSDDLQKLVGLQIRVRRTEGDTEELMGMFSNVYPPDKFRYFDCFGVKQNMVGHKNNINITKASMKWTAPMTNEGDLVFVATVVKDFHTFWYNVQTPLPSQTATQPEEVNKPTGGLQPIDFDTCGDTKGCFMYPNLCSGTDCVAAMTYKQTGDDYTIEMMGSEEGYISLGFSTDMKMTDDETISCTSENGKVTVQHGFNPNYYNERLYTFKKLKDMKVGYVNGKLYCQVTRPRQMSWVSMAKEGNFTFDLENDYYIFLAWGSVKGSEVISHHTDLPPVSDNKVNFREYVLHGGSVLHILVQVHGILMVIGWVFFVGIGTVIARFYKESFGGKKLCKLAAWFQIHRAVGISAWAVVAVSFVLIFVHIDGLTKVALNHAYIGIAVMAAATLQVLGGMFRPDKDSRVRPFFNWGHFVLGTSTYILAAVNTLLAFQLPILPEKQARFGTIVFSVWIGVQVLWEIVFRIIACREKDPKSKTDDKMDGKTGKFSIQEDERKRISNCFKCFLLMFYILTLCAFVAAGILSIVLF